MSLLDDFGSRGERSAATPILKGIDLTVAAGRIIGIIGESGVGQDR